MVKEKVSTSFIIHLLLACFVAAVGAVFFVSTARGQAAPSADAPGGWRTVGGAAVANWGPQFPNSGRTHGQPLGGFWGGNTARRPYPTNEWWSMLTLGSGQQPIKTYPYLMQPTTNGLTVCFPGRTATAGYITETMLQNMNFGAAEGFNGRQLVEYGKLHATLRFNGNGGGSMTIPFVRGMAYVSADYQGMTPSFTSIHAIIGVNPSSGASQKFKISLNNGQTWIIYFQQATSLRQSGSTISATGKVNGYVRMALLLDGGTESLLDQYADALPLRGSVQYLVQDKTAPKDAQGNELFDTARIVFNWEVQSVTPGKQVLMYALPHHTDTLVTGAGSVQYASPNLFARTIKGYVTGVIGNSWIMEERLSNIGWNARGQVPSGEVQNILNALQGDKGQLPVAPDPYFFGKQIAKLGRMALMADQLGQTDVASSIRNNMKNQMAPWLNGKFVYEQTYGGVVTQNSLTNSGAEFGMGWYNDHHFHFGYHVYAAAVIGRKDWNWVLANGMKIGDLMRDYMNTADDGVYPAYRHKDPFVGHSFAAGLFEFADIKNQESTSEGVNSYYAATLFSRVLGRRDLYDWSRILLATEIRSAQKYWHIKSDNQIYDAVFLPNKCVGIVWETKVDYATFFGANVEFIHGIQMMPFTPITEELLTADWISQEYPVLSTALTRGNLDDGWRGFIYAAHAIVAKSTARGEINQLGGYDDGNTKTNEIYWTVTRPGNDIAQTVSEDWNAGPTQVNNGALANVPVKTGAPQPVAPTTPPTGGGGGGSSGGGGGGSTGGGGGGGTGCQATCQDAVLGRVCYDPATHVCANNRRLCPIGTSECNLACFDTTNYKCCNNQIVQKSQAC